MKYIFTRLLFVIILMVMILPGCMDHSILYHSEASLPYYHRATKTTMKLIKDENATSNFNFGVISATDNDTLSYVLMASRGTGYSFSDLTDANLMYSVPLLPVQVKEFINILNQSADEWNNKYDSNDGIVYEFLVSPENRIKRESENVVNWYPTFRYYFQNNNDGPMGTLIFGEGEIQFLYEIHRLAGIKDLASMLSIALGE